MKTFITIVAVITAFNAPAMAAPKHHVVHQHAMDSNFLALGERATPEIPAPDDCIGLRSGTSGPSCGQTLTGGPAGGIN